MIAAIAVIRNNTVVRVIWCSAIHAGVARETNWIIAGLSTLKPGVGRARLARTLLAVVLVLARGAQCAAGLAHLVLVLAGHTT